MESLLEQYPDHATLSATLAHREIADVSEWSPPDAAFVDWLRANEVPPSVLGLLRIGMPRGVGAAIGWWP